MIDIIEYENIKYPDFQTKGNAAKFAIPFAKEVCKGIGYDIGCMKKEWAFPGSTPIDLNFNDEWHATNLPDTKVDYIFSSHCLEHIDRWVDVLDYWSERIKKEGTLFLYLPDYSQNYWRPWNNRKHINILSSEMIKDYLLNKEYINIFTSGVDLNNSFMVMGQKSI